MFLNRWGKVSEKLSRYWGKDSEKRQIDIEMIGKGRLPLCAFVGGEYCGNCTAISESSQCFGVSSYARGAMLDDYTCWKVTMAELGPKPLEHTRSPDVSWTEMKLLKKWVRTSAETHYAAVKWGRCRYTHVPLCQ